MSVLIVIPTFKEADNIASLIQTIHSLHPEIHIRIEDDTPDTSTIDAIKDAQKVVPNDVLFVHHRQGKGRGSAVLHGLDWGLAEGYDILFEMDADFSHQPKEIQLFLDAAKTADVVIGSRYLPQSEIRDWGFKRTFFSWLANKYARFVLKIPISDYTNGYRAYTKKALESIDLHSIDASGYIVLSEIADKLYKAGCTFKDVPTIFVNRQRGDSNLSYSLIHEAFFSILRIKSPKLYYHSRQIVFFLLSGALGALLDIGSLYVYVQFFAIQKTIAFFLSAVTAMLLVFTFNKYITFKNHSVHIARQGARFFVVYTGTTILNAFLSIVLLQLGVFYLLAKAIAIVIVAGCNYVLSDNFIFKRTA